jgi:hypothetical protein
MALTFKSKTENIEVVDTLNNFSLNYRFQMKDSNLSGSISGDARIDGRIVYTMNSGDGQSFNCHSSQMVNDDLTGLNEKMKADIIAIREAPANYCS